MNNIWSAEKTKVVNLDRYNILENKRSDGTIDRHFIGNDMDRYGARASTAIQEYDEETKIGITASGTEYHLHGEPGLDLDAHYLIAGATGRSIDSFKLKWPNE